ncbi:hypothetical protein OL548_21025 [Lysinibacillus sp. MHQ-1]|nr:hypothetical protein OL548_21025 [Lysinibacillus sp. MHQ-1]
MTSIIEITWIIQKKVMTMRDELGLEQARKLMMGATGETMKTHIDNNIESINIVMDESNKAKLDKLNQQVNLSITTFFIVSIIGFFSHCYVWFYAL